MKKIIQRANERGHADHGWLNAYHSFSFANYSDPEKVHFGLLRVLNDDTVAPSMGFGMHPHDNMEIVTIPLKGSIKHRDNMGNEGIIKAGDVQIMSAGRGVVHSEFNASVKEPLNLFQIWVFPKVRNITPRYDQKTFEAAERINKFQTVVSPEKENGTLWINQDAWFSLAKIEAGKSISYSIHLPDNGMYIMVISGEVEVAGEKLAARDAIAISETQSVELHAKKDSEVLMIEVPMG